MARYSLFVLKVPLNTSKANQTLSKLSLQPANSVVQGREICPEALWHMPTSHWPQQQGAVALAALSTTHCAHKCHAQWSDVELMENLTGLVTLTFAIYRKSGE